MCAHKDVRVCNMCVYTSRHANYRDTRRWLWRWWYHHPIFGYFWQLSVVWWFETIRKKNNSHSHWFKSKIKVTCISCALPRPFRIAFFDVSDIWLNKFEKNILDRGNCHWNHEKNQESVLWASSFWEATCHLSPSCWSSWWTELWNHLGDLIAARHRSRALDWTCS